MNAQTTYLHHSTPPIEGTTNSIGRRAKQLQISHKPYHSSVRTTAADRRDGHVSFRNFRRYVRVGSFLASLYIEHKVGIYIYRF